jgi:hypothetical protein
MFYRAFTLVGGWLLLALLASTSGARLDTPVEDEGVVFRELSGEETGLKAIMENWKADELQRQGGEFGDHGWWPWGLVAFDYNNHGALDLLVQHHGQPRSRILRNQLKETGTLTFVNANPELGLPGNGLAGCFKPLVWDFDGDGFLDLAFCDAMDNTCFFNIKGKSFDPMGFGFSQGEGIREIDVNDDGYPEVFHEQAKFLYDPGTRKFKRVEIQHPLVANPPEAIAAFLAEVAERKENRFLKIRYLEGVDLNGDGLPDVICAGFGTYGGSSFGRYLLANKDGAYTDATEQLGLPLEGTPVYAGDFNGDGIDDLLIAGAGFYLSDGKGKYALQPGPLTEFLKKTGPYLHQVYPVDFNNDGQMDLVVCNPRLSSVAMFENRGQGDFKLLHQVGSWDGDPVAVCDINNDGLMDVCIGGPGDTVTIFLNQTPHPGRYCNLYLHMAKPNPYAVGARVEVFPAGAIDKPNSRPLLRERAHPDGTPIHIGLGKVTTFDLRVTFPGPKPKVVELQHVEACKRLQLAPVGKLVKDK